MKRVLQVFLFLAVPVLMLVGPAIPAFADSGIDAVITGHASQEAGNGQPVPLLSVLIGCGPVAYDPTTGRPEEIIAASVTVTADLNGDYSADFPQSQCNVGDRLYIKATYDGLTYDDAVEFINGEYAEGINTFYNGTYYNNSSSIPVILLPASHTYSWPMGFININVPPLPSAPTNLSATTSTNQSPSLSWDPVSGAASYNVYQNGFPVSNTTNTSFTDSSVATEGNYTYVVTTVETTQDYGFRTIESGGSNAVTVAYDKTPPIPGTPSWSVNPITAGQTTNLSISATDNLSGVVGGEYYIGDTDPGVGNGTPMVWDGTNLTANFGSTLSPGSYPVNIRAKDAAGNWSSVVTTNLVVNQSTIPPTLTSPATASTGMNAPFDFTVTTTGNPTPTITEAGALPSGVTFTDNGNGTADLAGTAPTGTAGSYPITITANNGSGTPATQSFVLTVTTVSSAPAIISGSSDTETFGVPFSFTINTTGYPSPTLTRTGALPSGVTFTDNGNGTATIAGTPTASAVGVYTLTIKAKNSVGTTTQSFALTITKAPVIKSIATKTAHVGTAFLATIKASGYTTPALTESGALPNGITFTDNGNGTATLAGTPVVGSGGAYSITVTATNQLGSSSQTFTLKVNEAPVITSAASASATIGTPFTFQVTATGFPAPSLSKSGTLPKGITFQASTGTFSGTPKLGTAGSYPITITAKNNSGVVTQSFVLTVS